MSMSVLRSTTLDIAEHGSPNARDSQRILTARRDTEPAQREVLAGNGFRLLCISVFWTGHLLQKIHFVEDVSLTERDASEAETLTVTAE